MLRRVTCMLIVALLASVSVSALAGSSAQGSYPAALARPYVPAVSMEVDRRTAPNDTGGGAIRKGARSGASGLVRCGGALGTAQLTLRADIITTAAHVLIGADGEPRASCVFQSTAGGAPVPIDSALDPRFLPRAAVGCRNARLGGCAARAPGQRRGALRARAGRREAGWRVRVHRSAGGNSSTDAIGAENCNARGILATSPEGVREFAIDCSAAPGSSGAALTAGHNVVGIYEGYRSSDPMRAQAFSSTHYNFAITLEGSFRRALLAATR